METNKGSVYHSTEECNEVNNNKQVAPQNRFASKIPSPTSTLPSQERDIEAPSTSIKHNNEPIAIDHSRIETLEEMDVTTDIERRFNRYITPIANQHTDVPASVLHKGTRSFNDLLQQERARYMETRTYKREQKKFMTAFGLIFGIVTGILVIVYIMAIHSQATTAAIQNRVNSIQSQRANNNSLTQIEQRLDSLKEELDTSLTVMRSLLSLVNSLSQSLNTVQLISLQNTTNNLTLNHVTTQLNSLQSSVANLTTQQASTNTLVTTLQSSIANLTTQQASTNTQVTTLQSSIANLTTQQASTNTQITTLQSSVTTLTTRINSTVNLYQNCTEDTYNCTTSAYGSSVLYYDECSTVWVNPSTAGFYTFDTRCEYTTTFNGHFEIATIDASGANIRCRCRATRLYLNNGLSMDHAELDSTYTGTCTLAITRCPLTVNIL